MIAGLRLGPPTPEELAGRLTDARRAEVTYAHVGSTVEPERWPERSPFEQTRNLGDGDRAFDAAREGLRQWVCQRGIGATIVPGDTAIEAGQTLLVVLRVGPVRIVVPNRIVAVVDEAQRWGFGDGTLPGHHELGEEAFLVERRSDGSVRATVRVDAVPATLAARALGPAVTTFQHRAARRYLAALADFTSRET